MKFMKLLSAMGAMASLSLFAGAQSAMSMSDGVVAPNHLMIAGDPSQDAHDLKNHPCIHLAKDLIGMKVVNPEGEHIGKIEDIVVRPSGEVAYAVLSFGGFMGLGDKLFAMPWTVLTSRVSSLSKPEDSDASKNDGKLLLTLPLDKERMKKAPGFDKNNWPVMTTPDWAKDIDSYYAKDHGPIAAHPVEASAHVSQITWKCTDLTGFDVKTPSGEKLGDVKEIAVDTGGRINYVVLSVGGFLGLGERLVAVPWEALKFSVEADKGDKADKRMITLAVTKEQLENAPQFKESKDSFPEMCDPAWMTRMYEFYSVRPYWTQT
jgi:sporulation protein YlmC with PRC-barrel domain